MSPELRAIEFYSGIGGLHRALENSSVPGRVVRAFDWDQAACRVYEDNYGRGIVSKVDISTLSASDLVQFDASLWLCSPSCQPYTVLNPAGKGAADPRAQSFLNLIQDVLPDLIKQQKGPERILVENVAGFEKSTASHILVDSLQKHGYTTVELLLTPLQFGIPNSRLRYYLLAKAQPLKFASLDSSDNLKPLGHIPGKGSPWTNDRLDYGLSSVAEIRGYLDPEVSGQSNPCNIPDRVLEKWGPFIRHCLAQFPQDVLFHPRSVDFGARHSPCRDSSPALGYTQLVEGSGSILQQNEEINTTKTFDRFLAAKLLSESSVAPPTTPSPALQPVTILYPLRLRYFSPSELLRLFAFTPPADSTDGQRGDVKFIWPQDISLKTKYKLIGNSVNVEVVRHLIEYLFEGDDVT